jgi:hypothetical protein
LAPGGGHSSPTGQSIGFPVCDVCGSGREVLYPNNIFRNDDETELACGLLQDAGQNGYVHPSRCIELWGLVQRQCGCHQVTNPSSPRPTPGNVAAQPPFSPLAMVPSFPPCRRPTQPEGAAGFPVCNVCGFPDWEVANPTKMFRNPQMSRPEMLCGMYL